MQRTLILSFLLSLVATNSLLAQNDSVAITTDSIKPIQKVSDLYTAVDFATPIQSIYSDKQGAQASLAYQLNKKWVAIVELGYEKNKYDEGQWKVDVDGTSIKIGANWFFSQEESNYTNGFYLGARFAYASYNQTINQYPIRDINASEIIGFGSMDKARVASYWAEVVVGGRIQLYKNLYGDFSIHPAVYLGSKKQENIDPLVIPGYGRNNGPFNLPIFWGISYKLF